MSIDGVDLMDHSTFQGRSFFEWRKYDPKYSNEPEVSKEDKEALCKAFTLLDENGDRVLDRKELGAFLAALGRLDLDENIKELQIYTNEGATGMNFNQFQKFVVNQLEKLSEKTLREAFEVFDTQPLTGKLNLVELRAYLKNKQLKLTDDEINFLFREEDYWMLEDKNSFEYEDLINKLLWKPYNNSFLNNW